MNQNRHAEEKAMNVASIINLGKEMKRGVWILGGLVVLLTAACGQGFTGPTETRDDSFEVGDSPKVVVSSGNGRIIVRPGTDGAVRVEAVLRRPDNLEYEISRDGDTITVEAKEKGLGVFRFGKSPGADIEITTPSDTRVELRTSNGSVEVHEISQSGTVRASNGMILLEEVVGNFDISTSNGRATVARSSGAFVIDTSNGRIEFDGELSPGGSSRMTTSNGSIEITLRGTPSVKLDASTSNGSVSTELPVLTTGTLDEHHVVGTIGDGDAELIVRTSNGSIRIQ